MAAALADGAEVPLEVWWVLVRSGDAAFRAMVVECPMPESVALWVAKNETNTYVLGCMAKNWKATEAVLRKLLLRRDFGTDLLCKVADNPRTPDDVLLELYRKSDGALRRLVYWCLKERGLSCPATNTCPSS